MRAKLLLILLILLVLGVPLLPSPSLAEPPRSLYLMNLDPPKGEERSAWRGAALTELLRAKLAQFPGLRVLDPALRGSTPPASGEDPGGGAAALAIDLLPARFVVAIRVNADRQPDQIIARAETIDAVSGDALATVSAAGKADLAGLARMAEELTHALARMLGLVTPPHAPAYIEPRNVRALQSLVEGQRLARAGQPREALSRFRQAGEENDRSPFPEATRSAGRAYRSLVQSAPPEEARAVREEYLRHAESDTSPSGRYEYALALEESGRFREAAEMLQTSLETRNQGKQELRWKGERFGAPYLEGGERIHFLTSSRPADRAVPARSWVTLDAATGREIRRLPLHTAFPDIALLTRQEELLPIGFEQDTAYLAIAFPAGTPTAGESVQLAAVGSKGELIWRRELDRGMSELLFAQVRGGRIFILSWQPSKTGPPVYSLLTFRTSDGALLSRLGMDPRFPQDLRGLDTRAATFIALDGLHDLTTGRLTARAPREGSGLVLDRDGRSEPQLPWPTGTKGYTYLVQWSGTQLLAAGKNVLFLPAGLPVEAGSEAPVRSSTVPEGVLLFYGPQGYTLVDPKTLRKVELYADYPGDRKPQFAGSGGAYLAFTVNPAPADTTPGPHYELMATQTAIEIFENPSGRLAGRHYLAPDTQYAGLLPDGDLLITAGHEISRISVIPAAETWPSLEAEARYHLAACRLQDGDLGSALSEALAFGAMAPDDPRAPLLRMRISARRNEPLQSARWAFQALAAGALSDAEFAACRDSILTVHPEVREIIRTPLRGRLEIKALARPSTAICAPLGRRGEKIHLLVDLAGGGMKTVALPDLAGKPRLYVGQERIGAWEPESGAASLLAVDIPTGTQRRSGQLPGPVEEIFPGPHLGVISWTNMGWTLALVEQRSLREVNRVGPGTPRPKLVFQDRELLVFADYLSYATAGDVHFQVLDKITGRELTRAVLSLKHERLVTVFADRTVLIAGLAGGDFDDPQGRVSWLRILAIPLVPGGPAWSYESEGYLGGDLEMRAGEVSFAAYLEKLPLRAWRNPYGLNDWLLRRYCLPLRVVSLDGATGRETGRKDLPGNQWDPPFCPAAPAPGSASSRPVTFSSSNDLRWSEKTLGGEAFYPPAPRRIFPGRDESVPETIFQRPAGWLHRPGRRPAEILAEETDDDLRLLRVDDDQASVLWRGKVYEAGVGFILVKDFAAGAGLDPLVPPR